MKTRLLWVGGFVMCAILITMLHLYGVSAEYVAGCLLVALIMLCFIISPWIKKQAATERTEQLRQVAEKLGTKFEKQHSLDIISDFSIAAEGGILRNITNYLSTTKKDVTLAFFDYSYTFIDRNYGSESHTVTETTHTQSIIYVSSPTKRLPRFRVRPESLLQKVVTAFGRQDIDFRTHPRFSNMYQLEGDDESQIRKLFNDEVLEFMETQEKITVEGLKNHFIAYRRDTIIPPDEVQSYMDQGLRLWNLFRSSSKTRRKKKTR